MEALQQEAIFAPPERREEIDRAVEEKRAIIATLQRHRDNARRHIEQRELHARQGRPNQRGRPEQQQQQPPPVEQPPPAEPQPEQPEEEENFPPLRPFPVARVVQEREEEPEELVPRPMLQVRRARSPQRPAAGSSRPRIIQRGRDLWLHEIPPGGRTLRSVVFAVSPVLATRLAAHRHDTRRSREAASRSPSPPPGHRRHHFSRGGRPLGSPGRQHQKALQEANNALIQEPSKFFAWDGRTFTHPALVEAPEEEKEEEEGACARPQPGPKYRDGNSDDDDDTISLHP